MSDLTVLSMGWGVQTWTLAAMMALGEMPRTNYIVFADTHHEGQATYDFIRQWSPWLGEHGLSVVTVEADRTDVVRDDWGRGAIMIPALTVAAATGEHGQVRRQCTHDWKVTPVRHFVRAEMERRGLKPTPGIVEMQMGISWDEAALRVKDSDVAYITNAYPLVERRIKRTDCLTWLEAHSLPVPPKSACTFCPYKSVAAWRETKRRGGPDWQEAVEVDATIRGKRPQHGSLYVHPHRKPLVEAVTIPEDYGAHQTTFDELCDGGVCGV